MAVAPWAPAFAGHHIRGYVQPLQSVVQYLATKDVLRRLMDTDYRDESQALELFRVLQDANPNIHFIFAAYEDGRLVINDYLPPPWVRSPYTPLV